MGNVLSGTLANLFMASFEDCLSPHIDAVLYCRYVDDTLILTKSSATANETLNLFNNIHPTMKFELEEP